jgi:hypothetical protein
VPTFDFDFVFLHVLYLSFSLWLAMWLNPYRATTSAEFRTAGAVPWHRPA